MLEHVVEVEGADLVSCRVDEFTGVFEFRLDDEGRGVAVSAGGGVVGTGVPTLCEDVGYSAVLLFFPG